MVNSAYAIQHAQEIFKTALEKKELNRWQSDLRRIAGLVKDDTVFSLLENPEVSIDNKVKVLSERLGDMNPEAVKLVAELVAKSKLVEIGDIADEYQRLVDNYHGIEGVEVAEIITTLPLDDEDKLKIAQRITSLIGKPVVLRTKVDPSLIGGIIIKVGDKLIDGSIRSKLDALKREMGRTAK